MEYRKEVYPSYFSAMEPPTPPPPDSYGYYSQPQQYATPSYSPKAPHQQCPQPSSQYSSYTFTTMYGQPQSSQLSCYHYSPHISPPQQQYQFAPHLFDEMAVRKEAHRCLDDEISVFDEMSRYEKPLLLPEIPCGINGSPVVCEADEDPTSEDPHNIVIEVDKAKITTSVVNELKYLKDAGGDGKDLVTVEHCDDVFLAALSDSMQETEDWADLQVIESDVYGILSKIIEKELPKDHDVENWSEIRGYNTGGEGSSAHVTPKNLNMLSSTEAEDSDLEILSQKDGNLFGSRRTTSQPVTRSVGKQPVILIVYKSVNKQGTSPFYPEGDIYNDAPQDGHGTLEYKEQQAMDNIELANSVILGNIGFRPFNYQACKAAIENRDCFVLMPIGGGKSLCYQLPAIPHPGVTVVASAVMRELRKGAPSCKLLYDTPERIARNLSFLYILKCLHQKGLLARFVIDEAHGVSHVKTPLRVVPLVENLADLEVASAALARLFSSDWYINIINGNQEVKIGYIDCGKDVGLPHNEIAVRICRRAGLVKRLEKRENLLEDGEDGCLLKESDKDNGNRKRIPLISKSADGVLMDRAEQIQSELDEVVKTLNERCKQYGVHAKPTSLVELPFGWQPGIQEGAVYWDEDCDKFNSEGMQIPITFRPKDFRSVLWDPGKFQKGRRSIILVGNTSLFSSSKKFDITILKEPGHLNSAEIYYITGSIAGFFSGYSIKLSDLVVKEHDFIEDTNEPGITFLVAKFDGILGLGFKEIFVGNDVPVWYNMVEQLLDLLLTGTQPTKVGLQMDLCTFDGSWGVSIGIESVVNGKMIWDPGIFLSYNSDYINICSIHHSSPVSVNYFQLGVSEDDKHKCSADVEAVNSTSFHVMVWDPGIKIIPLLTLGQGQFKWRVLIRPHF